MSNEDITPRWQRPRHRAYLAGGIVLLVLLVVLIPAALLNLLWTTLGSRGALLTYGMPGLLTVISGLAGSLLCFYKARKIKNAQTMAETRLSPTAKIVAIATILGPLVASFVLGDYQQSLSALTDSGARVNINSRIGPVPESYMNTVVVAYRTQGQLYRNSPPRSRGEYVRYGRCSHWILQDGWERLSQAQQTELMGKFSNFDHPTYRYALFSDPVSYIHFMVRWAVDEEAGYNRVMEYSAVLGHNIPGEQEYASSRDACSGLI